MSWLDKLLGRGKKSAGEMTGDSSMKREGMHQEQAGMADDRRLAERDTKGDRRLEHASKQTNAIHRQLGAVGQATEQLAEQAKGLGELQQILRPPKARGGFGELLLGQLLADRLPPNAYETQYGFPGGERVDAVIKVDKLVPIDSKFPLDNFERMVSADNDIERQQHEKLFARDVKAQDRKSVV